MNNISPEESCFIYSHYYGDNEKALSILTNAIKRYPKNFHTYYNRSVIHLQKNDFAKAILDIDKAIKLEPNFYKYYEFKGRILNKKWHRNKSNKLLYEAISCYIKSLKINPKNINPYYKVIDIYIFLQEFKKAINMLNKLLKIEKSNIHILKNRAIIYAISGKNKKALEDCERYRKKEPDEVDYIHLKAKIHYLMHKYKIALQFFLQLKNMDFEVKYKDTYFNLALTFQQLDDYKKAIFYLKKSIKAGVYIAQSYNLLGNIYCEQLNFKVAINYFTKSIDENNSFHLAYKNRADAYSELKLYKKALADYKKASKYDKNNKDFIFYNIARIYTVSNNDVKASFFYEEAIKHGFNDTEEIVSDNAFKHLLDKNKKINSLYKIDSFFKSKNKNP